jgi:peptide/nickel transport system permease protein
MVRYILRRILLMVPVAFLVTVIAFLLLRLSPGDPVLIFAGEERDPATLAQIRTSLGLDQPLPLQYVAWIGHVAQGDFGRSIRTRQRVSEAIIERLPATLELGGAALLVSAVVAVSVGTLSAVKRNSSVDLLATGFAIGGVSLPNFFLGLVLILLFSLVFRLLPPGGYAPFIQDPGDNLRRLILPMITLATAGMAENLRQTRSSMLDVLGQDYMRTARAKGLPQAAVVARHALKNALIPVVTILGIRVGEVIAFAIVTESVFSWPGVGRLLVDSIGGRDYPVVQAVVLVSAFGFMLASLVVDVVYAWLDPRIGYR